MEWISVKHRLPEYDVVVLTYYKNNIWGNSGVRADKMDEEGKFMVADMTYQEVTHWMPMPEPPKEEDK